MMKLLLALFLFAQAQPPEFKVIADLAGYLSDGNGPGAIDVFDKNIPNYQTLSNNIFAMIDQDEISCYIDPIQQDGNVIEVDWFLKLKAKSVQGSIERRQMTVKLTIEKVGNKLKITAIDPPQI